MTDKRAKVFDTENELKAYLEAHKDADRSKHSVKPKGDKGQKPNEAPAAKKGPPPIPTQKAPPIPEKKPAPPVPAEAKKPVKGPAHAKDPAHDAPDHDEHSDKPKVSGLDGWKKRLTGLSDNAKNFVNSSSKAVQHFLSDDHFRKQALGEAKKALLNAPKGLAKNLLETTKHEVKEFKLAAKGVGKVISGGKMNHHEKEAFRQVATHIAIGGAAAAFAASGPLAGAAIFAKGLAKHIALKSVNKALAKVHMLEELSHVGHGISHFLEHVASDKKASVNPEEEMTSFILACVHNELDSLTDEDYQDVLNGLPGREKMASEVAARFLLKI